jgi:adenylate kinase
MVIFVAGVHGVGKTYLCQAFARTTGLRHASASQLIKEERQLESWGGDKVVTEIRGNQDALNIAVDRILQENPSLVLDGHFVLKKAGGVLEEVPPVTFERLGLSAIILVENDPQLIAERLLQRDSNNAAGDLKEFIQSERRAAINTSLSLDIPFFLMHNPSTESFSDCIESILEFSARK